MIENILTISDLSDRGLIELMRHIVKLDGLLYDNTPLNVLSLTDECQPNSVFLRNMLDYFIRNHLRVDRRIKSNVRIRYSVTSSRSWFKVKVSDTIYAISDEDHSIVSIEDNVNTAMEYINDMCAIAIKEMYHLNCDLIDEDTRKPLKRLEQLTPSEAKNLIDLNHVGPICNISTFNNELTIIMYNHSVTCTVKLSV